MFKKPTLLIDRKKVENNIDRMKLKADQSGVIFRPHFKTHQSAETASIFRHKGIEKITVSSVSMAAFFADEGWGNITIAFPVNVREIEEINLLAEKIYLNVLVESTFAVKILAEKINYKTGVFIKIDAGYHRTGLMPENVTEFDQIIQIILESTNLTFEGFLTHAGQTYKAKNKLEIPVILEEVKKKLQLLKQRYSDKFPGLIISYGDTPSCSLALNFNGFDEIRPGNFAYFDVMQYLLGVCTADEIAVAVACPVVAVHPERNELVVYGGAVHLSKEQIKVKETPIFGLAVHLNKTGWSVPIEGAFVSALSQEHGIIHLPAKEIQKYKPGDVIGILPVHSCLAADCLMENQLII